LSLELLVPAPLRALVLAGWRGAGQDFRDRVLPRHARLRQRRGGLGADAAPHAGERAGAGGGARVGTAGQPPELARRGGRAAGGGWPRTDNFRILHTWLIWRRGTVSQSLNSFVKLLEERALVVQ